MSQLDTMSPQDRQGLENWKAPETSSPQSPEQQTPQARAQKIIEGSKTNALRLTSKQDKPGWASYEDRLAVSERGWISQTIPNIKDPEVLAILQQRMAEIDQMPGIQEHLHQRALDENPSETWNAGFEKSKIEAGKLLEELPSLEAALQKLSPSDTISISVGVLARANKPVEISNGHPDVAKAINQFLERCKDLTVPGTAFSHTARAGELARSGYDNEKTLFGMELMWTGQPSGQYNKLRTNAQNLIRLLREGLERAKEVKNPYTT